MNCAYFEAEKKCKGYKHEPRLRRALKKKKKKKAGQALGDMSWLRRCTTDSQAACDNLGYMKNFRPVSSLSRALLANSQFLIPSTRHLISLANYFIDLYFKFYLFICHEYIYLCMSKLTFER